MMVGVTTREPLPVNGRLLGSMSDLVLMLGGCLIFFVVGGWLIDSGSPLGWLVLVPAAIGALLTMLMALISVPLVRTEASGVRLRHSLRPSRLVAWADAENFRADPDGSRVVLYDYSGPAPADPGMSDPWFTPFDPGRIDLRGSHAEPPEVAAALEAARTEAT